MRPRGVSSSYLPHHLRAPGLEVCARSRAGHKELASRTTLVSRLLGFQHHKHKQDIVYKKTFIQAHPEMWKDLPHPTMKTIGWSPEHKKEQPGTRTTHDLVQLEPEALQGHTPIIWWGGGKREDQSTQPSTMQHPQHFRGRGRSCSTGQYRGLQILELVPQLEELRRSQEDCVEGVDHRGGELEVFLSKQNVRHGVEDVLRIQEQTELPSCTKK